MRVSVVWGCIVSGGFIVSSKIGQVRVYTQFSFINQQQQNHLITQSINNTHSNFGRNIVFAINEFADLTTDEFSTRLMPRAPHPPMPAERYCYFSSHIVWPSLTVTQVRAKPGRLSPSRLRLPQPLSRHAGATSHEMHALQPVSCAQVNNQGSAGTCWAFSTIEAVHMAAMLA